jgi:hypothetical protein
MSANVIELADAADLVEIQLLRVGYEWQNRQIRLGERIRVPRALAKILHDRAVAAYPEELQGN